MCPPAPDSPADMVHGADDEVIMHLDRIRQGKPLPNNVIDDTNPFQFNPSNLPTGGIWYLVGSTEKKENKFGFWREKGTALDIRTGSAISGRRTTLEFIAGEQKTNWIMHEYKITETGKGKESRVMCRVLQSGGRSSNIDLRPNSRQAVSFEQGSRSPSLKHSGVDGNKLLSEADRLLEPRTREPPYMIDGDYLELDDLADPQSSSTSADNSSCSSFTLDEYFDSHALLQELEDKNNQGLRETGTSSKFSVTASVPPSEVVMLPATLGSLVCASGRQPSVGCTAPSSVLKTQNVGERIPDHTAKKPRTEKKEEDSAGSLCPAPPLGNAGKSTSKGKEKAASVNTKRLKKYMCFMPF
ncbi:unnamed protein product [Coffea canephora]|uniref:NAC domain-containing protein n=1 Tax=Coffea canephora TaxID=49390 RepID=A0A068UIV8_COFCA|nr:unnamed protein product [Coffea canephora]